MQQNSATTEPKTRSPNTWVLLIGISLSAFILRIYCLDCHSLWGDEINSIEGAQLGMPAIFTGRFGYVQTQTPLHYLLVWLTMQPFDPAKSALLVRLPSALVGSLTPLVVYGLGRELFGSRQALLAALLVALSATHINYSQELRSYAMLVFLTSLSVYALLRARRTKSGWWWAAFAISGIANVFNAYVALTILMPTLLPYLAWVLWKSWSNRREDVRAFFSAAASISALAIGCALVLLDELQVPRSLPDISKYNPQVGAASVFQLMLWFTRFAFARQIEQLLQIGLFILAMLGLYLALRGRPAYPEAAFLCTLFMVVPPILLSVFGTTTVVYERYALFSLPFYFLLISHALVSLVESAFGAGVPAPERDSPKWVILAVGTLIVVPFAIGAFNYHNPGTHASLSFRPDMKGVASYLADQAKPNDLIVFIDSPPEFGILGFYRKNAPPAQVFDARDPKLYAHKLNGTEDIYWVVGAEDPDVLPKITSLSGGWTEAANFERALVLKEVHPKGNILDRVDRMVTVWETVLPGSQQALTLRGSVAQGKGEVKRAVESYQKAGTYFPIGDEYLQTAKGFAALDDDAKAWEIALVSKFWQPQRPEVHEWLARKLFDEGFAQESRIEVEIAKGLEDIR